MARKFFSAKSRREWIEKLQRAEALAPKPKGPIPQSRRDRPSYYRTPLPPKPETSENE